MDYPSLDIIDIDENIYPESLKHINITLRGETTLFNIYFSVYDIESNFNTTIPSSIDKTWINTQSGRDKYLSYPCFKRFMFTLIPTNETANHYMQWIDSMLFGNKKNIQFFKPSIKQSEIEADDDLTEFDEENQYEHSDHSSTNSCSLFDALKAKIIELEHALELKNKDIVILTREVQLRDKEIEIMHLKMRTPSSNSLSSFTYQHDDQDNSEEWL